MRRVSALTVSVLLGLPTTAQATPYRATASMKLYEPAPEEDTPEEDTPEGIDYSPTSSRAPESKEREPVESEPQPGPAPVAEPTEQPDPDLSLQDERERVDKDSGAFNRHAVGVRGGLVVIPTWVLSPFLATHTNALCRGDAIGDFAAERGLLRQDGCNFYVGGEYTYRQSRILDIVGSIGYQSANAPDGYWLDTDEWNSSCTTHDGGQCNLAAADYTEVDLGMVFIEADFVARAPVVLTEDVELGVGGGAGLGLGIVTGGVHQTALGILPGGYNADMPSQAEPTCTRLDDLADFTRCTPRFDPGEEQEFGGDGVPPELEEFSLDPAANDSARPWAQCGVNGCNSSDLETFGYRKSQDDIPPVIPVVNLILSVRLIVKDVFGVTLNGGWNTGFYFGASMQYFFGKDIGKDKSGPAPDEEARATSPQPPAGVRF